MEAFRGYDGWFPTRPDRLTPHSFCRLIHLPSPTFRVTVCFSPPLGARAPLMMGLSVALSVPALPRVRRTHASPTSRSSASGDQGETDLQAHNELQKFSQSATSVNFKPAQVDSVSAKDFPDNPIGTKRPEWTCTGKDGEDYRATEHLRAFTTIKKLTLLIAALICPSDKYSTVVLDDLLKDTTVTVPGPADMDEAGSSGDSKSDRGTGPQLCAGAAVHSGPFRAAPVESRPWLSPRPTVPTL